MMEEQLGSLRPASSCASARTDRSMGNPISFQQQITATAQLGSLRPASSCASARTDRSMGNPISFQQQSTATDPGKASKDLNKEMESEKSSPKSSFKLYGKCQCHPPSCCLIVYVFYRIHQEGSNSAGSCVSLKSDRSMEPPPEFKVTTHSAEAPPDIEPSTSEVQCGSSDDFGEQSRSGCKHHMPHIMKELKVRIGAFLESEVDRVERILSETIDPEESTDDDEDVRSSREAVLYLSTHFLRKMKQDHLAQVLHSRTKEMKCMSKLQSSLKRRFQRVSEGVTRAGQQTNLSQIYTDLWITEGNTGGINTEHEVRQIQIAARQHCEKTVKCHEMFGNSLCGGQMRRMQLTKGVAGIGKTLCVQKMVLDWVEHTAHHNIRFMLPFSFRELNVLRGTSFSLESFVWHFFVEIKEAGICSFDDVGVVFIFDGLDESRLNLNFNNCPNLTDTKESVPLDVLLVNLIRGKLLPSAQIWITTRPAAASQIPAECVSLVTEVRGFTNPEKEQYFRKRFSGEEATLIINHMKTNRSLHIMCYIPIFCWILSAVLKHEMETQAMGQLPHTLTQMYIHFLVVQTTLKSRKYDQHSEMDLSWTQKTRKMVLSLGRLAFEQLQKGNLIFYESDLSQCELDAAAASNYSGVFTQVFKEEQGLYEDKVYCFIHLSVQEFLAALYVHLTYFNSGVNLLSESLPTKRKLKPMNDRGAEKAFYRSAVNKALQTPNGHLDLFLRFLLGLSLQSNQNLLQRLTKHIPPSSQSCREAAAYVKDKISKGFSLDMTINLFHCLNELGDTSLLEEVQKFLSSGHLSGERMSSVQWSALVFILLSDTCEVFELSKFDCSVETFFRLLPVIKVSVESSLAGCTLSDPCCKALAKVLGSESCLVKKLDLSYTELQDSGLFTLAGGPMSPLSNLQALRLRDCRLTELSCRVLCDLLSSPRCALTELDVSNNCLQDQGVIVLSEGLQSSFCTLTTLRMSDCDLTSRSCEDLSTVLQCHTSALRDLDLSNNQLQDSGLELLCSGLVSPQCNLEIFRLSGCFVTEKGFSLLGDALDSCRLRELDLRYNHPGNLGIHILSVAREHPACRLTTLRTEYGGECRLRPGLQKYACELTMDLNTAHRELLLFANNCVMDGDEEETPDQEGADHFAFWHQIMCNEGLTGRCYWEVKWRGLVSIAVTYRGIHRKENTRGSKLGGNLFSWSLDCTPKSYYARHNDIKHRIPKRDKGGCSREATMAVYLDWDEGDLSFFNVLPKGLELIYTFHSTFSEPLFPAFRLRSEFTQDPCNCVTVCPVQMRQKKRRARLGQY